MTAKEWLRKTTSVEAESLIRLELLGGKLPEMLDEKQKVNKVRNYLAVLHRNGVIERDGNNKRISAWRLTKK